MTQHRAPLLHDFFQATLVVGNTLGLHPPVELERGHAIHVVDGMPVVHVEHRHCHAELIEDVDEQRRQKRMRARHDPQGQRRMVVLGSCHGRRSYRKAAGFEKYSSATSQQPALSDRSEPRAGDIFDLNHLFARPGARALELASAQQPWLARAIDHAMGLSFDEYSAQVVAFLDPSQRQLFEGLSAWDAMQAAVVEHLESLQ